jgi:hypothetical protein
MRTPPELARGRTPVQIALARIRLPAGPRACEAAAIATVALVAAGVLAPLTLAHQLPNAYDTDAFYAPFATFLHDRLSHGDLPLWNPFAFSGQPFAADPQSGVFYPPALVSYGLLAPATGMVLLVTFHYQLATLSSYAFARLVGAGRLGAVYAGLAFGVSGYLLARSQALGLLSGAAWLAACVAAAQFTARREGRGASPLVLAGALALSILSEVRARTPRRPGRAASATAAARPPGPAGRLVLADPPYPGWSVTIDGNAAPVRDQGGLLRAVDLPAGRHTVEWRSEPRSVKLGFFVTLAALLAAVVYAVVARRRYA